MAGWAFLISQKLALGEGDWAKVIGAVLFSLGIISVILFEASLFTGKIGYVNTKKKLLDSLIILVINLMVVFFIGLVYQEIKGPSQAMDSRLAKEWYEILIDAVGTGACIYITVEGYKKTKSFVPVILGIVVFILAGFEHCVADMFFFGTGELTGQGLGYIGLAILGNGIGSLLVRWLQLGFIKANKES